MHERKVFMKYARVLTAAAMLAASALAAEALVVDVSSAHARIAVPPATHESTMRGKLIAANVAAGAHAGKAASPGDVIGKGAHSTKRALRRFARKLKRMTRGQAEEEDPRHAPEVP